LSKDGFIKIPQNITCIKIDVGLSFDAPHAISWLRENDKLFVIGFEPLIENIEILKESLRKQDSSRLIERFLIVQCALSSSSGPKEIFVTSDKGQSSLLEPEFYKVESRRIVETETLDNFINLVNFEVFEKIDYIKTDCQGFDLEVMKGAVNVLKKTVVVTCEAESINYKGASNSFALLEKFFNQIGFEYINRVSMKSRFIRRIFAPIFNYLGSRSNFYIKFVGRNNDKPLISGSSLISVDPTFVNSKFKNLVTSNEVSSHQFN
jgi:FkbM family methyltransferase